MASRYRKVHVSIYGDAKFRALSAPNPNGQSLFLFLLTSPLTSIIPGLFCAGEATLAEALNWSVEGFRERFQELSEKGMAKADFQARVLWLPKGIKYNPPDNPNVCIAWGKAAIEIPECPLKDEAIAALKAFLEQLGERYLKGFLEGLGERSAEPSPEGYAKPGTGAGTEIGAGYGNAPAPDQNGGQHAGPESLLDYFCVGWRQRYGADCSVERSKGIQCMEILWKKVKRNLAVGKMAIDRYLNDDQQFFAKSRHAIHVMTAASQIDQFLVGPARRPPVNGNGKVTVRQ